MATDSSMRVEASEAQSEALVKPERQSATSDQVPFSAFEDPAAAFCCWLLHFIDLESAVVIEARPVSHAAVLGRYLDAVAAEPLDPVRMEPDTAGDPDQRPGAERWPGRDSAPAIESGKPMPKICVIKLPEKRLTRNTHLYAREAKEKHTCPRSS